MCVKQAKAQVLVRVSFMEAVYGKRNFNLERKTHPCTNRYVYSH